jgi:putative addiction module component (TIGR02574 family)
MSAKETVIEEAMKLSELERLEIAERLYESLDGPADVDAEEKWAEAVERRLKAIDAGQGKFISWPVARRQIQADEGGTVAD